MNRVRTIEKDIAGPTGVGKGGSVLTTRTPDPSDASVRQWWRQLTVGFFAV